MTERSDFWARRKAAVQAEEDAERQTEEARELAARQDEKSDAEILAELNLPDPDTMQPGDDVAGFMTAAVPERLRRRALRQLWRLNPVLANVDGLVDYGEDYTGAGTIVEDLQTAYQVGKGMLAHVEEMARQASDNAEASPEDDLETAPELAPAPVAASADPARADEAANVVHAAAQPGHDDPIDDHVPAPRRMRFEFEG